MFLFPAGVLKCSILSLHNELLLSIFSENYHNYVRPLFHRQRLSAFAAFRYSEVANLKKI